MAQSMRRLCFGSKGDDAWLQCNLLRNARRGEQREWAPQRSVRRAGGGNACHVRPGGVHGCHILSVGNRTQIKSL